MNSTDEEHLGRLCDVLNEHHVAHVIFGSFAGRLQGADLRLLDWIQLTPGRPRELGALYDDCSECNASTFFTVFYYDITQHG